MNDQETLARTIWAEARSEGGRGMQAVACVILNRVDEPGWWTRDKGDGIPDDTIAAACRDPWQFSAWNPGDPNLPKLLAVDESDPAFKMAMNIAQDAVDGRLHDITDGATHYHVVGMKPLPKWAEGKQPDVVIGRHAFYALGPAA